ncbi:MAG: CopD family protein [Chloroflexi bacterium]|jgi:uncharacterized membrane protein|nr:CopD family protein [Chloroflexota bacterium]
MPFPLLAFFYWLHMLATVVLVGSLSALSWLLLPAMRRSLSERDQVSLMDALQRRLEPLVWFCLGLLIVTGLFQMSVHPNYNGLLATGTRWSLALFVKHLMVVLILVVSAVQTWEVMPAIRRALLRPERLNEEQWQALARRQRRLLSLNMLLSLLVLAATAVARVS